MSLPATRATAIKHAERVLAELVQRDSYSHSDYADALYRLEVAQISVARYRRLCADHRIELKISREAAESIDECGQDRTEEREKLLDELRPVSS